MFGGHKRRDNACAFDVCASAGLLCEVPDLHEADRAGAIIGGAGAERLKLLRMNNDGCNEVVVCDHSDKLFVNPFETHDQAILACKLHIRAIRIVVALDSLQMGIKHLHNVMKHVACAM